MPFLILLAALAFPFAADAHMLATDTGFMSGLKHPVLGLDHLLAMLSVGLVSTQIGGRAIWTVPSTFVLVMALGAVVGILHLVEIPEGLIEFGIALSVAALGFSVASERKFRPLVAMGFVGFFALFHGYAHGKEMPELAEPLHFALGFMTGTAAIHIAGVAIGLFAANLKDGPSNLRYIGAGISGAGFFMLAEML